MSEQQQRAIHSDLQPKDVFECMIAAANRHDLEAMVACFAPDYRGELPFTLERSFTGQAGVRKNWSFFFATMPDFRVEIISIAVEGDTVWAELFFAGTRADGTKQMMRGVNIAGIQGEQIAWAKLYQSAVQKPSA
jgi:ketosteroid isomerase-like protein